MKDSIETFVGLEFDDGGACPLFLLYCIPLSPTCPPAILERMNGFGCAWSDFSLM